MEHTVQPTEIENEAKTLIPEDKYNQIVSTNVLLNESSYKNEYFDTTRFKLFRNGCTLRVRIWGNKDDKNYKLHLKVEREDKSISEYHSFFTEGMYNILKKNQCIPNSPVRKALNFILVYKQEPVFYKGVLSILRKQIEHNYGEHIRIYIDQVFFEDGYIDYEIEVESDVSLEDATTTAIKFCGIYDIEYIPSPSKYNRMLSYKGLINK